jgi:hypothetical protein
MKKTIKINESQLNELINNVIMNESMNAESLHAHHWENMFEKSIMVLVKMGHDSNDLKKRIDDVILKHSQGEFK